MPKIEDLLVNGHILPVRDERKIPQIIIRFQSPILRGILFKFKKVFIKEIGKNNDIYFNEDLTRLNFQCMMKLKAAPDIKNVWSMQGRIKFTTKTDEKSVQIVKNIMNPLGQLPVQDESAG